MKRLFAIVLCALLCVSLCACGEKVTPVTPLEELTDYTLEQAKTERVAVYEDHNITSGQNIWDKFEWEATVMKQPTTVRLVFYYTLEGQGKMSEELYNEVKDDYPKLYVMDLTFDGEKYTRRHFEDGKEITYTYKHLVKCEDETRIYYAICDNPDVKTIDELYKGMLSSQLNADSNPHALVYCKKK